MRELISTWGPYLKDFYEYKRLSGFKYNSAESVIYQFDRYYKSLGINELKFTRDIVEPFLYVDGNKRIATRNWKASVLRQFGDYLIKHGILDHIYLIPPISLKGEAEFIPYIFSNEELSQIINYLDSYMKSDIPGTFNARCNTLNSVSTVIKVLMATGMRINEVLSLRRTDIDLDNQLFIVKESKNNNERLIPFSNTIKQEIVNYILKTPFNINKYDRLFQIEAGKQLNADRCWIYFNKAIKATGIKKDKGPRIHDLRHTYAVMALTQLQKSEKNINLSLSYLSDYLGHKSLRETQKYLWITPELFDEVKYNMSDYTSFIKDIYDGEKYDD